MEKTTFTNQFFFKPCSEIFTPLVKRIILFSLCWIGSICLTFSQANNSVKLLTKQKVILDTFSIATNKPLSSLRTQVYIDYQKPNSKKFWKNLALFSGTLVLQSQLNKTNLYKEPTVPLLTQNNQNVLLPSISLGLLPSLWKNRPRKIPKLNLKVVHKSSDGNILNVWEKPLTSKAKEGAELLDLSIDSSIRLGKIEISLENYSDRKVYFWGNATNIITKSVIEETPIEEIAPYKLKRVSRYPGKLIESVVDEKIVVLQKTNKEVKGSSSFLDFTSTLSPQTFDVTNVKPKQKPVYSSATTTAKESDCKALEGQVWDGTKCVFNPDVFCKANFGDDFSYNSSTGACDFNDPYANESCPSGETYQAGVGDGCPISECEDSGGEWENNACNNPSLDCVNGGGSWQEPNCLCSSGLIWDDDVKECIIDVEVGVNQCPSGLIWDDLMNTCVIDEDIVVGGQNCLIQGKVWDEATQSCITPSTGCPYGYYDDGWGSCIFDYEPIPPTGTLPPVTPPSLPPVQYGTRTYYNPETRANYYSSEKKCEGIQDIWNNAVSNNKEVLAFLLSDGTLVTLPYNTSTNISAVVPPASYNGETAGTYFNGVDSFVQIVATIHTHNECINDHSDGVSGLSNDDVSVFQTFLQFSPPIKHYVMGCGVVGETDINGSISNKQWGTPSQTCWNIK